MTSVATDLAAERARAVRACLDDVRAILAEAGLHRPALERVKGRLLALAQRRDLFTFDQFPLLHERSTMHVLAEDGDGLTLYAVTAQGESATPGKAELEQIDETLVAPDTGVALMPDDIHSIHRASDSPLLHFHLYGRSIERLPERKQFDLARGTYEVYPASPNIHR